MNTRFEKRKPPRPADPLKPPARPRPPDIRKTPNVFHFVMCVLTAGMWVVLWAGHAIANGIANGAEQRRYDEAMARYKDEVLAWQLRWKKASDTDWVPQVPE